MVQMANQNQAYGARITSTERHQKNNISSANPKKAIVTPRNREFQQKQFGGGHGPTINTDMMNQLAADHQQNVFAKNQGGV